jgi:hypothetical protein
MEGTCFESDWAAVAAGLSGLRGLLGRLHQAGSERLGPMFADLDAIKMLAEAGQVAVLGEGLSRGDVRESDAASPAGWVRQWGHSYAAGGAAGPVAVTVAISKERNRVLREAVLAARAPVRNAAVAIGEMDKLRSRLTPEAHDTVLAGFVALAEAQGPREVRALRPALIAKYGHLGEFQRREDRLKHGAALSQPFDDDGMAEYRLRLDPEGSAVLEAILGPLAAPQPSTEHGSDLRTSDQRRADALVEVCRRAAAAGGDAPAAAKAAVVVTVGYQDLKDRTGAGTTLTGQVLAPETVRRLACDAGIIPVVLGSQGEVLDLGRTVRLATPKQVKALWIRDQGCTFPGCSRPPAWCDAHHVWHWCDGGPTDLSNLALLCPRHHTIVHQRGYPATVSALGVTWHL